MFSSILNSTPVRSFISRKPRIVEYGKIFTSAEEQWKVADAKTFSHMSDFSHQFFRCVFGTSTQFNIWWIEMIFASFFARQDDYRLVSLISAGFTFFSLLVLLPIPESPTWLVGKRRLSSAQKSLAVIRGTGELQGADTNFSDRFHPEKLYRQGRLPHREGDEGPRREHCQIECGWQEDIEVEGFAKTWTLQAAWNHDILFRLPTVLRDFCDICLCSTILEASWSGHRPAPVCSLHRVDSSRHHTAHGVHLRQVRSKTAGPFLRLRNVRQHDGPGRMLCTSTDRHCF